VVYTSLMYLFNNIYCRFSNTKFNRNPFSSLAVDETRKRKYINMNGETVLTHYELISCILLEVSYHKFHTFS
jgi:hypothetical protein